MRIYGLTGGTGSGKSEAAKRFAHHGAPVIDADLVGHEAIAPGGAAEEAVRKAFGDEILSSGAIDRDKLGRRVFADEAARQRLNAIVHPAIVGEIGRRCAALAGEGRDAIIIDAALLCENGAREPWLAGLILVTCGVKERLRRLVELRGIDPEEARRRMRAQTPPEFKAPIADWVIANEGSIEALHEQVDRIVEDVLNAPGRP